MNLKVGGLYYSSGGMPNLVYEIVKLTEELVTCVVYKGTHEYYLELKRAVELLTPVEKYYKELYD